jgi:MFS family permease
MIITPKVGRTGVAGNGESGRPGEVVVRHSSWQLLGCRYFRLYFFGSLGSNLGTWLQGTAQVLLAYQLTHSVFDVGAVVSAQFAGTLILSPWAAVLADRIGTKVTLVGSQATSAVIAAAMAWRYHLHVLGVHSLIFGALGLGLAFALALPVQTALVPSLVNPPDTEAAMAMNAASYNAGRALAPALCVLVIAFVGPDLIFALNAASFAIFAIILSRLKPRAGQGVLPGWSDARTRQRQRVRVTDGFRAARRHRRILLLLAIVAAVTFADDPVQVLSPGLAHGLHVSGDWAGYFIAALGWGAVAGSLQPMSRRKVSDPSHASQRAAWWLLMLALSMVLFTTAWLVPITFIAAFITIVAAFMAGAAALFTGAATQALIVGHDRTTAASVGGLWAIAWAGTKPVASLLDGWLASHLGIWSAGILLASPAATLALCEILLSPARKERIKNWSLSEYLETTSPSFRGLVLFGVHLILRLLRLDNPSQKGASERRAIEPVSW